MRLLNSKCDSHYLVIFYANLFMPKLFYAKTFYAKIFYAKLFQRQNIVTTRHERTKRPNARNERTTNERTYVRSFVRSNVRTWLITAITLPIYQSASNLIRRRRRRRRRCFQSLLCAVDPDANRETIQECQHLGILRITNVETYTKVCDYLSVDGKK